MKTLEVLACGALIVGMSMSALATVLHVPSEYRTIQAGINTATTGDTVLVTDGTYTGDGNRDVDFVGKAIVVMSENGPENTIINCEGSISEPHRGFYVHTGEDSLSVVQGFTIRNGVATGSQPESGGGAIQCYWSAPMIVGNILESNMAQNFGGAILCFGEDPIIRNNIIRTNVAGGGGGIFSRQGSPKIRGNMILNNTANWDGGGIQIHHGTPHITDNVIAYNTGIQQGGGIYLYSSNAIIVRNKIVGNQTTFYDGGGIYCTAFWPTIMDNQILGNISARHGGAIHTHSSYPTIIGNAITGNEAAMQGGGMRLTWSSPMMVYNTVTGNTAVDGAGIFCWESNPTIAATTIACNICYGDGGAIYCYCYSSPTIINSICWGDTVYVGSEIYVAEGSAVTVTYSDVQGGWPGQGNIDVDPMFAKPDWKDYRLLWGSPCIDPGHPDSLDPDSTRKDMGAHFFNQSKTLVTYMTPETDSLCPGDSLHVLYTLINCHDEPQPCGGIVEVTLPNGEPWSGNPLEGPGYGIMHPHYNCQYVREYEVPEMCPLGTWGFTWKVGMPGELFDRDSFRFRVVEP